MARLRAAGHPVKLGNCLPTCFLDTGQAGCLAGLAFFSVDPWGRVRPCNHAPVICGNLLESTVEEIWGSPELEAWRSSVPAGCATCPMLPTCRGGCRAQAMLLGLPADPLIQKALPLRRTTPERVAFYREARPVGLFEWRQEAFGSVLMHGNRLLAVAPDQEVALGPQVLSISCSVRLPSNRPRALSLIANLYHDCLLYTSPSPRDS